MSTRICVRKPWSIEEDLLLSELVNQHGATGCWPKIAMSMNLRNGKQCRERYVNHLDPDMKRTAWSMEESKIIRDLFPTFGTKWSLYIPALPGRSDNAIKNRYHMICKNNFEYCFDERVVTPASQESDADTNKEDLSVEINRNRLGKLKAARGELDREISALEQQCSSHDERSAIKKRASIPLEDQCLSTSYSGSSENITATTTELDGELNFDFDWTDEDTMYRSVQDSVV